MSEQATPTILRIKRRRRDDHEALDALVIESPARPSKKSRSADASESTTPGSSSSKGIFRFAETVSPSTFTSEASQRSLKDRITSLLLHPPRSSGASASSSPSATSSSSPRRQKFSTSTVPLNQQQRELDRKQARYKIVSQKRGYADTDSSAATTGIKQTQQRAQATLSSRRPTAPPIVRSTAPSSSASNGAKATVPNVGEGSTKENTFKILEAQIESDSDRDDGIASTDPVQRKLQAYTQSKNRKLAVNRGRQEKTAEQEEEERLMTNFIPMLQEYLSLSTPSTPAKSATQNLSNEETAPSSSSRNNDDSPPHPALSNVPDLSAGDAADSDSEWVYDVYYRDAAPAASSTIFYTTRSGIDAFDMGSGSGEGLRKIGALSGLEDDEIVTGDQDSDEDSDMVNTDDEDSNEEDFYRNDYPEGEGEESDEQMSDTDDDDSQNDDSENDYGR